MNPPAMNPYLPLTAYIPDGEPRVFDGRLYVYGSHDLAGGEKGFCPGDYEVWSAPVDDLGRWTCHGVSLARSAVPGMMPWPRPMWSAGRMGGITSISTPTRRKFAGWG